MRWGILRFPGSHGAQDRADAVVRVSDGRDQVLFVEPAATVLLEMDAVALPAGASFGDLPHVGQVAARTPVIAALRRFADGGGLVVGVGNGFQILCEAGLLPGRLRENACGHFIGRAVCVRVENVANPLAGRAMAGDRLWIPIAARYAAWEGEPGELESLERNGRIVLRYDPASWATGHADPIGSQGAVAALSNHRGNVVGTMVNPEYVARPRSATNLVAGDGSIVFESLRAWSVGADGRASSAR